MVVSFSKWFLDVPHLLYIFSVLKQRVGSW